MKPSRFHLTLALAASLHGGAWLVRNATATRVVSMSHDEPQSFDIEIAPSLSPGDPSQDHIATRSQVDVSSTLSARPSGSPHSAPSSSGDVELSTPTPANSNAVMNVWNMDAVAQQQLGVTGNRTFATPPPPISDNEIVRQRVQHSIQDGLRDQEVASGDPVSGPIVHALEEGTRASLAPINGRATFDAVLDAGGVVLSIGTVDSTSNRSDWDTVARTSAATLIGKRLRTSKNGLVVRIEVTSRVQLPSGSLPGVGGDVLKDSSGDKSTPHAGQVSVLKMAPKKPDLVVLEFGFDVSDIGAHPTRVVAAHVTSLRDL